MVMKIMCCVIDFNLVLLVLTILVMVLIGYQLINVVLLEKRICNAVKRSEKRMAKKLKKVEYKVAGYAALSMALSLIRTHPEHSFLQIVFAAEQLYEYDNNCGDVDFCLKQLKDVIPKIDKNRLSSIGEIKEDLLRALYSIEKNGKEDIIKFVLSL